MARKYDLISELYNRTCKTVVSNPQNWQAFLASACRNYKLRYDEQLLVYAQRPDATAVLEIEQWNKIFGRWVNRGARGIAVFADENRSRQRLTHYFDISDTHESRYSRTVPIWDMRQEYEADVIETLESTFGEIENKSSLAEAIMGAARNAAEDIDETALSYAEIKMLATGNPYIKEKMDLDIQVQKLKMLKSNFLSEKYGLEDKVIKFYPQQIAYLKSRVEGLTKDVKTAKLHPKPIDEQPLGMTVSGVSYSEKAEAGQAIINACKSMNSPDAIPLGEYRGFQMELYFDTVQRNYVVKLKGETSRDVPLGDDSHGNIVRIDNGIERFEETLADTKNSLENTEKQFETAKQEIEKPFAKEEELKAKTARLDELNILLNMDKKENEIVGGEPDEGEAVGGRKEKSYER
jgi:hypothetical protein